MTMGPTHNPFNDAKVLELQGLLRESYDYLEAYARKMESWAAPHTDLDFLLARIDHAIS